MQRLSTKYLARLMGKAGDHYRELVGAVMAAVDPGSAVKTEQWIKGPDGERDMDVEIRGMLNGIPHFILVECKDHARPIGIGFVDAFESKIRDLNPDRAIMFSNSGFTRDALKKASRVGIEMASAMKAMEDTIRIEIYREVVARRISISLGDVFLFPFEGHPNEIEPSWKTSDLLFDGLPVLTWIDRKTKELAVEYNTAGRLWFLCTFRHEARWTYHGKPLNVGGLKFRFDVHMDWVSQTAKSQVSLGYYDHLKKGIVVPPDQWFTPGILDNEAWETTDSEWEQGELEPNSFRLLITIIRSKLPHSDEHPPKVEELIAESRVDIENAESESINKQQL